MGVKLLVAYVCGNCQALLILDDDLRCVELLYTPTSAVDEDMTVQPVVAGAVSEKAVSR